MSESSLFSLYTYISSDPDIKSEGEAKGPATPAMANVQPATPKKAAGPSMRTPTHGPAYGEKTFPPDRPSFERNAANQIQASQPTTPSQRVSTRERYRPTEYAAEAGDDVDARYGDARSANIRVFNDTQRPPSVTRRDSYPPETEPTTAPILSQSRRGSIVSAAGNRPRGLSFYDARQYMKSGVAPRPESYVYCL
jgi:hypothetical protein